MKRTPVEIRTGQIWASGDPRDNGRLVMVDSIVGNIIHIHNMKTHHHSRSSIERFRSTPQCRSFYLVQEAPHD